MRKMEAKPGSNNSFDQQASSRLLVEAIRKLTSSASGDQRELEKSRLERAYRESGDYVDKLFKEHQTDVGQSLGTFRKVSNEITACRQRIHSVKSSLQMCKILLTNRRDELKKLWVESAEQQKICHLLRQIEEIKHIDVKVVTLLKEKKYRDASEALKRAEILLNGPLATIEGLRSGISDMSQILFDEITTELLRVLVVEPFELKILELVRSNQTEIMIAESQFCSQLLAKYSSPEKPIFSPENSTTADGKTPRPQLAEMVEALNVFDQLGPTVEHVFVRLSTLCVRALNDTVLVVQLLVKTGAPEATHFGQLIKIMLMQMRDVAKNFDLVLAEVLRLRGPNDEGIGSVSALSARCWDQLQELLEQSLSEHLGIYRGSSSIDRFGTASSMEEKLAGGALKLGESTTRSPLNKTASQANSVLFSFDNTSFVSRSTTNTLLKKRQLHTICTASVYNVVPVFHSLNRFCVEIESQLKSDSCSLRTYLHTCVMEAFVETVRMDMETRMESALSSVDPWATQLVSSHGVKLLTSCLAVFELCDEIAGHTRAIELYTQRFASIWLLIIAYYTKTVNDQYSQIIRTRTFHQSSQQLQRLDLNSSSVSTTSNAANTSISSAADLPQESHHFFCSRISASWAADEDISRLLKSLPTWTLLTQSDMGGQQGMTPSSAAAFPMLLSGGQQPSLDGMSGSAADTDARRRGIQRESELLIGNLGQQAKLQRAELVTDMDHIKSLICLHESLQWFVENMRRLLQTLPPQARAICRCRIQLTTADGRLVEQFLDDAIQEHLSQLEHLSETCLLMLYLELRVHCFYHLLPLARSVATSTTSSSSSSSTTGTPGSGGGGPYSADESSREVLDFTRDLQQLHATLQLYTGTLKLSLLFDGLGHLCASIFIHSAQWMTRLSGDGRKRLCRQILAVQKCLGRLTQRPEKELLRAQHYYDLLAEEPDSLLAHITERGLAFSAQECTSLLSLCVRSHPVLGAHPGALDSRLARLKDLFKEAIQQRSSFGK